MKNCSILLMKALEPLKPESKLLVRIVKRARHTYHFSHGLLAENFFTQQRVAEGHGS